ncbi:hypothetical protein VP1G_10859 [Cytospora mali]|uniref:Uncharacterized protein n=1 Tax=Cytospora mali TaxID=578113 RepID=A0A194UZG2_CYTMA|nr:hypothetical protein VP1G_10859 [Valsa mali var. pyri (nom. inval.)]
MGNTLMFSITTTISKDIAADNVNLGVELPHLIKLELRTAVLAQPVVTLIAPGNDFVLANTRVQQPLAPRPPYSPQLLLQVVPDQLRRQRGEQVGLVGGDEHGDGVGGLARLGAAHALLQGQQHVVQCRSLPWPGVSTSRNLLATAPLASRSSRHELDASSLTASSIADHVWLVCVSEGSVRRSRSVCSEVLPAPEGPVSRIEGSTV